MPRFLIEYEEPNLPAGGVWRKMEAEFEDWTGRPEADGLPFGKELTITARQWAEDAAATLSDKGPYRVTEITG